MKSSVEDQIRELDHRAGDGVDVRLLWSPQSNRVLLRVIDWRSDEEFELSVRPGEALDAFQHPFAYIGRDEPEQALAT